MRRNLIGSGVIATLIVVLALTSGFRVSDASGVRPVPSEIGIERIEAPPFEFGSVSQAQSFR